MNKKINIYLINDGDYNYYIAGNSIISVIEHFFDDYVDEKLYTKIEKFGFDISKLDEKKLSEEIYDKVEEEYINFNKVIEELKKDEIKLPMVILSKEE